MQQDVDHRLRVVRVLLVTYLVVIRNALNHLATQLAQMDAC